MKFSPYPKPTPRIKPTKPLRKSPRPQKADILLPYKRTAIKRKYKPTGEMNVFKLIWQERSHNCSWCHVYLGEKINHSFFDHIVPVSKSKALQLEESNIRLLCIPCHNIRHNGTKAQIQNRMKIKMQHSIYEIK